MRKLVTLSITASILLAGLTPLGLPARATPGNGCVAEAVVSGGRGANCYYTAGSPTGVFVAATPDPWEIHVGSALVAHGSAGNNPAGTFVQTPGQLVWVSVSSTSLSQCVPTAFGNYACVGDGSVAAADAPTGSATAQPDFSLSASPSSQTVKAGQTTSYTVSVTPANGFSGQVSLSVSGLPSDTSATFSPNPTTSSSTMTVTTKRGAPAGSSQLTVTGTSGSLTHTTDVTLTVTKT